VVGRHRGRRNDDVGAVGAQHIPLVLADLVGADEDALVAALLRHQGQANTGIAGRRFDDRAPGLQFTAGLGGIDHLDRDAVLGATTGIEVFDLRRHQGGTFGHDGVQPDERRIAYELTDMTRDSHASIVSGGRSGYQVASRM
jgi:hypothetical protein